MGFLFVATLLMTYIVLALMSHQYNNKTRMTILGIAVLVPGLFILLV